MRNLNLQSSQRLIELLAKIEHQISFALIESIRHKEHQRVSYLDFGNSNDNISYIINNKVEELIDTDHANWKELVWTEKRTNLKIGKFIKMLYGDTFPVNQPKDRVSPRTANDIESFVNMYKAEREKNENYNKFEIVKGDAIRYWYSVENYSRYANNETSLGKSCMRYTESGRFLSMYTENPDIFSMLILKDNNGKLKGRAIIWNLVKPEGRIFLDRVYSVNDYDVEMFKGYAREMGWLYRKSQSFGWFNQIIDPVTNHLYESTDMLLEVTLNKYQGRDYEYFPYLDTLSIYNKNTHVLCNDGNLRLKKGHLLLTDYQGRYHSEVDERPRVFSSIYNQDILEEESTFVEIDNTYVYRHDAIYVHNSNGKYAYKNSEKIVMCCLPNKEKKFFIKEDAVWSEYLDTYLYKDSVREAYMDEEKTKLVLIHYRMIGKKFIVKNDSVIFRKQQEEEPKKVFKKRPTTQDDLIRMLRSSGGSLSDLRSIESAYFTVNGEQEDTDLTVESPDQTEEPLRRSSRRISSGSGRSSSYGSTYSSPYERYDTGIFSEQPVAVQPLSMSELESQITVRRTRDESQPSVVRPSVVRQSGVRRSEQPTVEHPTSEQPIVEQRSDVSTNEISMDWYSFDEDPYSDDRLSDGTRPRR